MKNFLRTLLMIASAVIFMIVLSVTSYAKDSSSIAEEYKNPYGSTLCAARKGYWHEHPENSLSAVKAAVEKGADIVEVDVRKTSDNVLILMEDETVTRTCYGYDSKTKVSDMTYDEISKLSLLDGQGGSQAAKTDEKVPSLEELLKQDNNCLYLVDNSWSYKDEIYNLAEKCGVLDSVIFLIGNTDSNAISEWTSSLELKPMIMTYFKGNVIFSAFSAVSNSLDSGAECVYLASKVSSGVVYSGAVMGKTDGKIRAMANTTNSKYCGTVREDTEVWWDELIGRGYSVILTDYPDALSEYIERCETKRSELSQSYAELVTNWKLPDFKSDKFLDYKHKYNNAVSLAKSAVDNRHSSESDIVTAIYRLRQTHDNILNDYESLKSGTAGLTVTPVRVLLCILAAAAVISAEIFVYKKKKKSDK